MTTNVSLTPELERFARARVESGDYSSISEVVRGGLRLLKEREDRKQAFMATLLAAQSEADDKGSFAAEDVLAEMDRIIAESE